MGFQVRALPALGCGAGVGAVLRGRRGEGPGPASAVHGLWAGASGPGPAIWGLRTAVRVALPWSEDCDMVRENAQADVAFVQRGAGPAGLDARAVACVSTLGHGVPDVWK